MRGISFRDYEKSFRGAIESDDLNNNLKDIYNDLAEAYRREQYINNRLREYASDLSYQCQMLAVRLSNASAALIAASGSYAAAGGNVLYWSAYSNDGVSSNSSRHDLSIGEVTLPWSRSYTKIPLVLNEYGDYEVDSSVKINYCNDYYTKPDDLWDLVDNNPETNWVKSYPLADSPGQITLRIELPSSTNPAMNSIYISPYPDGGPRVDSLRYLNTAGAWVAVPGFTDVTNRKRFHFTPIDYGNQIDLTMVPVALKDSNGVGCMVFGIQDIDVSLIEYVDNSEFVVMLNAAAGTTITNITYVNLSYTISPAITNESSISSSDRPVLLQIYEDAGLTTQVYSNIIYNHSYTGSIGMTTPGSTIWAKVTLRKINSTTPVVTGLTIKYN